MLSQKLPDQMKAIVLESYSGVAALRVDQKQVPKPGKNEVLIKIAASPINPSDLAFIEGLYGLNKTTPVVPGLEGSGVVVAAGPGLMGRYLMGKRVACVAPEKGDGTWAEFMLTKTSYALPLNDAVGFEQGSMSVINPLTAIALVSLAREEGHTAFVNTAAGGALGQMLNRLGQKQGLKVINIVRSDTQVETLQRSSARFVLDSSEPKFEQNLKDICHQHQVRLAFDAIAGPMTLHLLEAMPRGGKVTIYGGLSFEAAQANPGQIIFQQKAIDGFWLTAWMAKKGMLQNFVMWRRAQKLMETELTTEIRNRYPLADAKKAVINYQEHMSRGKILFLPGK